MHKFLIHKAGDHVGVATSDIGAGEKVIGVYMDDDSTVEVEALGDVPGLYFMDSSSAAAEHVTLMGSGGAVLHMFPTGQENVIGNPIVPVIKDSGNPNTVRTMSEHIDVDVCGLLSREITLPQAAGDLMTEHLARTANGRLTSAEALGHREFTMTKLYRGAEGLGAPKTTPAHPQSRRDG